MLNLGIESKLTRVSNAVAAGTTDINSSSVDMTAHDGVLFVVAFGAITATAVTSIKAQQSSDDGVADAWSDLAGTAVTVADTDDNKLAYAYLLTPKGLQEKTRLTIAFLKGKQEEYERLQIEIALLQAEVDELESEHSPQATLDATPHAD